MKTWVEISRKNLLHNVGQFLSRLDRTPAPAKDRRLQKTNFMAVVKSNAYGHGLPEVTRIIHESDTNSSRIWYGVDNLDEAKVVREIAPRSPVLVLGYTQNERLREAAKLGARITVYNWETVKALRKLVGAGLAPARGRAQGPPLRVPRRGGGQAPTLQPLVVHVKVETGTTRQGIPENEMVEYVKALQKIRGIEVEGISTHFADSEDLHSNYALGQITRYNSVVERLKQHGISTSVHHAACTAATLRFPETHGNLVRVGIGLYGLWPSDEIRQTMSLRAERSNLGAKIATSASGGLAMTKLGVELKPVLIWKTIIAQVKEVKKDTPVSDRGLSKLGHVLIGGKRCKILGRVCMNMCMGGYAN